MSVLVTGGAGYIGSHTIIELANNGYDVVVVDNLCNSKKVAVERVEKIIGKKLKFYQYDVCDIDKLREIFKSEKIDAVIHFAGLKAVGESCKKPLEYYRNNLISTLNLILVMRENGCKNLVFSSSATVYGQPKSVPIKEDFPLGPCTNPYGSTKLMIEDMLRDIYKADPSFNMSLEDLEKSMEPSRYVGRSKEQVEAFVKNVVNPVLEENRELLGVKVEINV